MPTQGLTGRDLRSAIVFGVLVYLGIRFIAQIVDVLLIFSIIALLVAALNPTVTRLARHRIPRSVSAAMLALSALALMALLGYIIIPPAEKQVVELGQQLSASLERSKGWLERLQHTHPSVAAHLPKHVGLTETTIRQVASPLLGGMSRVGASAAAVIAGFFIILLSTIYSLANPRPLSEGILKAFGPDHRERVETAGERLGAQIHAWVIGVVIAMLSIFLLTWIVLAIMGFKQAFLFAVIAGLLEAVPIVGPVLSAIPPLLVALTQNPVMALWVVVAFVGIQQVESHILVPMVMSRQLSLHPVTVIFAVLVMGGLFGIVGMFLATPAAATVGILYEELYLKQREQKE